MTRNILVKLRNTNCNLVGSSEERITCIWYDFIKTKYKETLHKCVDLISLAQGQVQWRPF